MQNLVAVINQIQDAFVKLGMPVAFDLPIIAVVGSQSVGKSSVLEAIVGSDLLPRGSGTVTRRPLILQLIQIMEGECYAEFQHQPAKRYAKYAGVTEEIEATTKQLIAEGKSVSSVPISLKIYARNVPNLTLVDLPGLVSVSLPGEDPAIKTEISDMVLQQIKKPNCLILAVSSGNVDIANSEALRIAKEVDPGGHRTIGVLTKLDMIDKGTEDVPVSILTKKDILKFGFYGVVCRSQQDIVNKTPMSEAIGKEEAFFTSNSQFSKVLDRCGIKRLSQSLSSILTTHITYCLPRLREHVSAELQKVYHKLEAIGVDNVVDRRDPSTFFLELISKYVRDFCMRIDGGLQQESSKELMCGARIRFIFSTIFTKEVMKIGAIDWLSDQEIYTTIQNAIALRPSILVPESALECLVRTQLHRLLDPSMQCVTLVYNELVQSLSQHQIPELEKLPELTSNIVQVMTQLLQRCVDPTKTMIKNLIKVEEGYISLDHPDMHQKACLIFAGIKSVNMEAIEDMEQLVQSIQLSKPEAEVAKEGEAVLVSIQGLADKQDIPGGKADPKPAAPELRKISCLPRYMRIDAPKSERGRWEVHALKELMNEYFRVVKRTLVDLVPKTIMAFLINEAKMSAQNELVKALYSKENIDKLLQELPEVVQKRAEYKKTIRLFEESLSILSTVGYRPAST